MDKEKIAPEWELCKHCKHNNSSLCMGCTEFYAYRAIKICGIYSGEIPLYYHKNFEKIEDE